MKTCGRTALLAVSLFTLAIHTARAQAPISPEQACDAVRAFVTPQVLDLQVDSFTDGEPIGALGCHYEIQATGGSLAGSYWVDGFTGAVVSFSLETHDLGNEPAAIINQAEAQQIAEEYIATHFPAYSQGEWRLFGTIHVEQGRNYDFVWFPVVGSAGALGPWSMSVAVDGVTSEVVNVQMPRMRFVGPTVPVISREQAIRIATPYAEFDLNELPFNLIYLQIEEDDTGIQWLTWHIGQQPDPVSDPVNSYEVIVDAMNGTVWGMLRPLGGPFADGPKLNPRARPVPAPRRMIGVRLACGEPRGCGIPPVIEKGRVWVRAEQFRALGARVAAERPSLAVRTKTASVAGTDVRARWKEWGWWVPLRATAERLGWKVTWQGAKRGVLIDNGT